MPLIQSDDFEEMLSQDDWGVPCSYNGNSFNGIFSQEYYEQQAGEAGIASSMPVLYAAESELDNICEGEVIMIDSDDYVVAHFEPDGEGMLRVVLNA